MSSSVNCSPKNWESQKQSTIRSLLALLLVYKVLGGMAHMALAAHFSLVCIVLYFHCIYYSVWIIQQNAQVLKNHFNIKKNLKYFCSSFPRWMCELFAANSVMRSDAVRSQACLFTLLWTSTSSSRPLVFILILPKARLLAVTHVYSCSLTYTQLAGS